MKPQFPAAASGTTDDERPSPAAPTYAPTTHDARGTTFYALRFTFHVSRFTSPWLFTLALLVLLGLAWGAAPIDVHADHPAGSRLYVNDDAPGPTHDGATWSTAFTRLQVALTHAVSGTEIWVATGVYTPGTTVSDTFTLKSGVAIYGGFAATETLREQRDWRANVTVLSGDLEGNDTTNADGVVTDTDNISGANSYHVLVGSGTDATALLDGFTVTAGHANGSYLHHDRGAGMRNVGGSPTVANVTFSGNLAAWAGGGMFNEQGSNSILTNVTFSGNSANLAGGGMSNLGSRTTLTNITFIGNSAEFGGGMIDDGWSNSILTNVTFSGNSARTGGGMYASGSGLALIDVTFSGNRAEEGGGLANVRSEMTLTNVTFSG
ncbi:MAG TPA: right-handed parallel beta-helix repeat-containing protein, partial [Ardenticatenaceae bacterium]|nr:right-handed parallel beta-helix repeat-containing protein [Ardenticatenaceae bacterium]